MTRNSIIVFAALLAIVGIPPASHAAPFEDGLHVAQAAPPADEKHPPGKPPAKGTPAPAQPAHPPAATAPTPPHPPAAATVPAQPHPPAASAAPAHPGPATVQTSPVQAPQRPTVQQSPAPMGTQTPIVHQPVPPAAAQGGPTQPPQRADPGRPAPLAAPATAQTPPNQQPPRPGVPAVTPIQAQRPTGLPAPAIANAPVDPRAMPQHLDQLRGARHETHEGNRTVIREADRTIVREGGRDIIQHDEADRFRFNAREVNVEHRGNDTVTVVLRPDGSRIITEVDPAGRLLRRVRRDREGREVIIIDNSFEPRGPGIGGYFVTLPPPTVRVPRELYIREAERATPEDIFLTLVAPPVDRIDRRYALDEIRYSETLRERMPRVDIDTVNFETGSWEVTPDQVERLAGVAQGITRAIRRNPGEVFLIEGYTDAVGNDIDNLSLSDHRAESVAVVLTNQFGIPPENLTTQGYGRQFLKVPTEGPERANRRVAVRRITPLLTGQN